MRALVFALVVVLAGACYPVNAHGECETPLEDRIWIDDGTLGPGYYCFDDGDGYPTIYPSRTNDDVYPTVGGI